MQHADDGRRPRRFDVRARLRTSPAGRAIVAISGATAIAQIIGVAAAPILTRLYSPEQYGAFFLVNSLALSLSAVFAFRLELAVPLPTEDRDGRALATSAATVCSLMLLLAVTITLLLGNPISGALGLDGSGRLMLLIGPLAASFSFYAVLNAVAMRERRYGAMARRQLIVAVLAVGLQVVAGVAGTGAGGLAAGMIVAQTVGTASLWFSSPLMRRDMRPAFSDSVRSLRRYSSFPLILAPAGLLNSLGANAPLLVIGTLYATEAAGWFGLTLRIVAIPAALVGTAIAQVYLSELAARRRSAAGTERSLFIKTSATLAGAAVVFGTLLFVLAPYAFELVFGPRWATAGDMARAYAIAAVTQMIASPVSQTLVVYERVVLQLLWDASRLLATVGSVVVAWTFDLSAVSTVWVLSFVTAICYCASWDASRRTLWRAATPGSK